MRFDITLGRLTFYSYRFSHPKAVYEFNNYSNHEFYGQDRIIRWAFNIRGYSYDFNIYKKNKTNT